MLKEKIKEFAKGEENNKKKIENLVFLIVILIVTTIVINLILKENKSSIKQEKTTNKVLAVTNDSKEDDETSNMQKELEQILSTIKGVGKVKVYISYSESSKTIAMYDEKTTTSSTEETDSSGGLRNTTSTQTQKDVIFSEKDGSQVPMTQKVVMTTIEGALKPILSMQLNQLLGYLLIKYKYLRWRDNFEKRKKKKKTRYIKKGT